MRKADIEVGKSYLADRSYPLYGARVRVLETDVLVPRGYRSSKLKGTRVVVERASGVRFWRAEKDAEHIVMNRALQRPWTEADDAHVDEQEVWEAHRKSIQNRVRDHAFVRASGDGLFVDGDHAHEVLDALGVPR